MNVPLEEARAQVKALTSANAFLPIPDPLATLAKGTRHEE